MFEKYSFRLKMVKDGNEEEVIIADEIKNHFERNKTRYVSGAAITVIVLSMLKGRTGSAEFAQINIRPISFFSKQTVKVVSVIERAGRGHPGYITECIETGEKWRSQGMAAKAIGLPDVLMSKHIAREIPDLHGLHYRRVP